MTEEKTATFAEFARLLGFKRSYVTELKAAGRLVLTEDGTHVLVEASRERIAATKDPSKAGVAQRHAAARAPQDAPEPVVAPDETTVPTAPETNPAYQEARARREHYLALAAQRDYEQSVGKLIDRDAIQHELASASRLFNSKFEQLPALLAPQLVGLDETQLQTTLADWIGLALSDAAKAFAAAAELEGATS